MGRTLTLEFKNYKFENRIKTMTFPHYLETKEQYIKFGVLLLNQAWPVEACRLMGLRLQNMREKRKRDSVKVCPLVNINEVEYLKEDDGMAEDGENMAAMALRLIKEARRNPGSAEQNGITFTDEIVTMAKNFDKKQK